MRDSRTGRTAKTGGEAADPADFFDDRLALLEGSGGGDGAILVPVDEREAGPARLSRQFTDDAALYHARYFNTDLFETLLSEAIDRAGIATPVRHIVDIGSGSGNSVIPALKLFPEATIFAVDLSPDLLAILKGYVDGVPAFRGRTRFICSDVTRTRFRDDVFDLALGTAILHHLLEPRAAVTRLCRSLKPGGCCIFLEPFETGNAILKMAYREILGDARIGPVAPEVSSLLNALVIDHEARFGFPDPEQRQQLDDKWLFTRGYFEDLGAELGLRRVVVYPVNAIDGLFTKETALDLQLGLGADPRALPDWAWKILERYDEAFSEPLREELILRGCIILQK